MDERSQKSDQGQVTTLGADTTCILERLDQALEIAVLYHLISTAEFSVI